MKYTFMFLTLILVLFACGENTETEKKDKNVKIERKDTGELTMAYYETDSIIGGFNFYVKTQKDLEAKKKGLEAKLDAQQKAYQSAAMELQRGMNNNSLSQNQIEGLQGKMRRSEEEVYRIQQSEGMKFEQESQKANEVLFNKIELYAKEFAEQNGFKLFLSKGKGGQIVYADSTFDVTAEFIEFMNMKEEELDKDSAQ